MVFTDAAQNIYRKLVIANQRIVGAVLYGDTYAANSYLVTATANGYFAM
ncbi:hypothetical protein THIOSC15_1980043 [uncultured Thiomicrorhabdus sp.]